MIKLLEISTQTEISKMRRENNRWLGWNTDYKHLSKDTHFRWKIKRHDLWVRPAASCMFACGIRSQGFDTLSCQESAKIPHPPPPSTLHLFCAPLSSQSLLDMERPWAKLAQSTRPLSCITDITEAV